MTILCFTGHTGAGKSVMSRIMRKLLKADNLKIGYQLRVLARKLNMPFDAYIEHIYATYGRRAPVVVLQKIIDKKISSGKPVILEGIYKKEEYAELKHIFPKEDILVFDFQADRNTRVKRIMHREKKTNAQAEGWVTIQDAKRKNIFRMDELAALADSIVKNETENHRKLLEEFKQGYKRAIIRRIASVKSLKTRLPK